MFKEFRYSALISSAIMLITGIILIMKPGISMLAICYTIAATVLLFGVTRFIGFLRTRKEMPSAGMFNLIAAVFTMLLGLFFLISPTTIAKMIPVVLGIIFIADGLLLFISGFALRSFLPKRGVGSMVIGALNIIFGFVAIMYSFATTIVFMEFIGFGLVFAGITNIINHFMAEKAEKKREDAKTVDFSTEPYDKSEEDTDKNIK